jgi:type I restriction enzyme M protein
MLTQETKRKIDSARQILVGKVPDPKAQVDQITTAMIYKFMDDMDKDAMELGGKARFFTNGFEKYAWSKLMDLKLGGHERLELYAEAVVQMSTNPHIPQLFRDIFKDAFLPYRSPETLSLFLKEINSFTYDHSEDLGDAFEYLLSIMGSQGDAGQFRTPRHIIDFIVAVVDPKKDETILDPACGTAGFLISAYKHILKQHDGLDDPDHKEKPLTPDEKKKLMGNLFGYDISPDMVKLSKVNMYLHGFAEPKIFEYDTLSSDEKWDEMYDVIMANPPFMSPKGGIRPHKRFSVQANRAEVLFVDYIKEHLRPNGRAGVIVPEGIIFKNDVAYKQLRKLLVEDGLFAVVSLPAGVFNPYSGVKTSILFFDNSLAKLTKNILFVKINNDGYDLGAQRREVDGNDLPRVLKLFKKYIDFIKTNRTSKDLGLDFILENQDLADLFVLQPNDFHPAGPHDLSNEKAWELRNKLGEFFQTVAKEKVADGGSYNLSSDRYNRVVSKKNQEWPMVELGDVLDYEQPTKYIVSSIDYSSEYSTPVLTAGKTFVLGYTNEQKGIFPESKLPVIIFDDFTTAIKLVDFPFKVKSSAMKILHAKEGRVDIRFAYYMMQTIKFPSSTHKRYWISEYSKVKVPLPPVTVQRKIVEQIEDYQKIIDGAKQVVKNWKPNVQINPLWSIVTLPEVCEIKRGKFSYRPRNAPHLYEGKYPFIQTGDVVKAHGGSIGYTQTLNEEGLKVSKLFEPTIVLITIAANIGDTAVLDYPACFPDSVVGLIPNEKIDPYFLQLMMELQKDHLEKLAPQMAQKNINIEILKKVEIPVPPINIQLELVEQVQRERQVVNANKQIIKEYETKIQQIVGSIFGGVVSAIKRESQEGLIKQLQDEFVSIESEVIRMMGNKKIFEEIVGVAKKNSNINQGNSFWDFLKESYVALMVSAVCRQVDPDERSASLYNLLKKILYNPTVIQALNKDWYSGQYHSDNDAIPGFMEAIGERDFANNFGSKEYVDPAIVYMDLKKLEEDTKEIKKYRNKRVAHRDRTEQPFKANYDDLHKAVETVRAITSKYYLLLKQGSNDLIPIDQTDWQKIFTMPWIGKHSDEK